MIGFIISAALFVIYPSLDTVFVLIPYTFFDWGLLTLFVLVPSVIQWRGGGLLSAWVADSTALFGVYSQNYLYKTTDFVVAPGGQRLLFAIGLALTVGLGFSTAVYAFRWLFSLRGSAPPDTST